jgi:hypothetical protein
VRGIVIHAASYVGPDIASMQGGSAAARAALPSNGDIDHVLGLLGPGRLLYAAR